MSKKQKRFIVLYDSAFIRDAQRYEGDDPDDMDDDDSGWTDVSGHVMVMDVLAESREAATNIAAQFYNVDRLIIHEISGE